MSPNLVSPLGGSELNLLILANPQSGSAGSLSERLADYPLVEHDDERLSPYLRLRDKHLRAHEKNVSGEHPNGVYIAESSVVVRRAQAAGHTPVSFFVAERYLQDLADVFERAPGVPIFVGTDQTLEAITGFHLHRGALAVYERPPELTLEQVLATATRIAIVENVVDHSNLGAIVRNAAALGVDALILSPECADPLYRRAIRVSMGTVFSLCYARADAWPDALETIREAGFTVAALALDADAVGLQDLGAALTERAKGPKVALMLGSEGPGLSAAALAKSDLRVTIPMAGAVDSLNVAAASAIAFWQVRIDDDRRSRP